MDTTQQQQQQQSQQPNIQRIDIEQFLCDVRDHFRASLETSEYENASNLFHVTAAEATIRLLQRCEHLLKQCTHSGSDNHTINTLHEPLVNGSNENSEQRSTTIKVPQEDASYLDMTAHNKRKSNSTEYINFKGSTDSDKTFRSSTNIIDSEMRRMRYYPEKDEAYGADKSTHKSNGAMEEDDPQIYDICNVSAVEEDETLKAMTSDLELNRSLDCPYSDVPSTILPIHKSSKYGQLQRIEKRLFFDQSKKCYCVILNDWLLCYADGPLASRPSTTLHLRSNGVEIEHSGDGKRRELCFQLTTADPNKKLVFQANNEVEAKEWIHAIETAIRSDAASLLKNARKLPTPPVLKKLNFISASSKAGGGGGGGGAQESAGAIDCIYEEPSPLYDMHETIKAMNGKALSAESTPPDLPEKTNNPNAIAMKFEYDVPKCPPQPLELETIGLLNNAAGEISQHIAVPAAKGICLSSKSSSSSAEKLDFQAKVKDVHTKLSSQLSLGGSSPEHVKKLAKKTYSTISNESDVITLRPPSGKEQKKQKKNSTPSTSSQKRNTGSNNNNNNNINNNNSNGNNNGSGNGEKTASAKNWFLNRLNKTTSSTRNSNTTSPAKSKQSEKENLLNSLEMCDTSEGAEFLQNGGGGVGGSSNPASPVLKANGKSKVNMIINQFEASGLSVAVASFTAFCEGNDCNNYEPIMTVSTPPSNFMKKV